MERDITLRELVAILRRHWLLFVTVFGACLLVAATFAAFMRPVYRAEVLVMAVPGPTEDRFSVLGGEFAGLAGLVGLGAGSTSRKDEALATLKSRAFTEGFILQFDVLPRLRAVFGGRRQLTLWDAQERFSTSVRHVSEDPTTGMVKISIDWIDREEAAAWANAIVDGVNEKLRQRAIAEAEKSIEYLNRELSKTNVVELRQVLFRLIEEQVKTIVLASVRDEYAFRIIDPALAPDSDDYHRPNRPLIIIIGAFVGLLLGGMSVTIANALRHA